MNYNGNGYLSSISAGGATRQTVTGMNARQQLTSTTYGSNLNATFGFDSYGYPTSTQTGSIQDYRYSFNAATGNLSSRQNYLRSKSESFEFDNLDRLTDVTGPQNLTMTFNDNGNINTKSDIGTAAFEYGTNAGPYALTGVTSSNSVIPTATQTATYNSFQKVSTLSEDVYSATFIYNAEQQRAKMDIAQNGTNILTRWYAGGSYMKETASSVTKEYTYLGGDAYSAPVAAVTQSGTTTYYYLLRDHLGNITHQVNTSNSVVAEYSFDAWGRRRNPSDWSYDLSSQPDLFAGRGFTIHEHLPWFNLVNMNGRLYDPLVGRFLSVDNVVQDPTFTQSYNRYSYCWNNPLKFADPDGNKLYIPDGDHHAYIDWGGSESGGGGQFILDHLDPSAPGMGHNGDGVGGSYYDWSTGEYRSSGPGHEVVGFNYIQSVIAPYTIAVSAIIYTGTRSNPYETLRGFHFTDHTSFYYGDGGSLAGGQSLNFSSTSNYGTNLDFVNTAFSAIGTVAGWAEIFTRSNADAQIAYTTFNGVTRLVSSAEVLGTFKLVGKASLVGGVAVDVGLTLMGKQSLGKTGLNTAIGALPFIIGTGPGLVIGVFYLVADKTGMFDRPTNPTNYTPPSIAMPDATRVAIPIKY